MHFGKQLLKIPIDRFAPFDFPDPNLDVFTESGQLYVFEFGLIPEGVERRGNEMAGPREVSCPNGLIQKLLKVFWQSDGDFGHRRKIEKVRRNVHR